MLIAFLLFCQTIWSPDLWTFFEEPQGFPRSVSAEYTPGSTAFAQARRAGSLRLTPELQAAIYACFEAYYERLYCLSEGKENKWDESKYGRTSFVPASSFPFYMPTNGFDRFMYAWWTYSRDQEDCEQEGRKLLRRLNQFEDLNNLGLRLAEGGPRDRPYLDALFRLPRPSWDGGFYSLILGSTLLDWIDFDPPEEFPTMDWVEPEELMKAFPAEKWAKMFRTFSNAKEGGRLRFSSGDLLEGYIPTHLMSGVNSSEPPFDQDYWLQEGFMPSTSYPKEEYKFPLTAEAIIARDSPADIVEKELTALGSNVSHRLSGQVLDKVADIGKVLASIDRAYYIQEWYRQPTLLQRRVMTRSAKADNEIEVTVKLDESTAETHRGRVSEPIFVHCSFSGKAEDIKTTENEIIEYPSSEGYQVGVSTSIWYGNGRIDAESERGSEMVSVPLETLIEAVGRRVPRGAKLHMYIQGTTEFGNKNVMIGGTYKDPETGTSGQLGGIGIEEEYEYILPHEFILTGSATASIAVEFKETGYEAEGGQIDVENVPDSEMPDFIPKGRIAQQRMESGQLITMAGIGVLKGIEGYFVSPFMRTHYDSTDISRIFSTLYHPSLKVFHSADEAKSLWRAAYTDMRLEVLNLIRRQYGVNIKDFEALMKPPYGDVEWFIPRGAEVTVVYTTFTRTIYVDADWLGNDSMIITRAWTVESTGEEVEIGQPPYAVPFDRHIVIDGITFDDSELRDEAKYGIQGWGKISSVQQIDWDWNALRLGSPD